MKLPKNITLDVKVIEQIQKLSDLEGRRFSNFINKVLLDYINKEDTETKNKMDKFDN